MNVANLQTRNFRNLHDVSLDFGDRVNVLVGDNGQGKSNILEALFLTSRGESFRLAPTESFVRAGDQAPDVTGARVQTQILKNQMRSTVTWKIQDHRRSITVNGKVASRVYTASRFPMVAFSPESLNSIKLGPDYRRELIDGFLISLGPEKGTLISDFRKLLKARNQMLRTMAQEPLSSESDPVFWASLDEQYLEAAARLSLARAEVLARLGPWMSTVVTRFFGGHEADFSVHYVMSGRSTDSLQPSEVQALLRSRAAELRAAEKQKGRSLVGPQNHDLAFQWRNMNARFCASQGQQRGMVLAFKMSQILYHFEVLREQPVLLLDDVMSELDQLRREQLMSFLTERPAQIFLSTTDRNYGHLFPKGAVASFQVTKGDAQRVD
jgi:DNA replication and repair protein RecF